MELPFQFGGIFSSGPGSSISLASINDQVIPAASYVIRHVASNKIMKRVGGTVHLATPNSTLLDSEVWILANRQLISVDYTANQTFYCNLNTDRQMVISTQPFTEGVFHPFFDPLVTSSTAVAIPGKIWMQYNATNPLAANPVYRLASNNNISLQFGSGNADDFLFESQSWEPIRRGVYQLKKNNKCYLSDGTMGSCQPSENRSLWVWRPETNSLESFQKPAYNINRKTMKAHVGEINYTQGTNLDSHISSCDPNDKECLYWKPDTEAPVYAENKKALSGFILQADRLIDKNRKLCYNVETAQIGPCALPRFQLEAVPMHNRYVDPDGKVFTNRYEHTYANYRPNSSSIYRQKCPVDTKDRKLFCNENGTTCNTANRLGCCLGVFVTQYRKFLGRAMPTTYTYYNGGWNIQVDLSAIDPVGSETIVLHNRDFFIKPFNAADHDEPTYIIVPFTNYNINTRILSAYIPPNRYGTDVTSVRNSIDVGQFVAIPDPTKCSSNWCPWSETRYSDETKTTGITVSDTKTDGLTCDAAMIEYCSTMDEEGHPRMNTDVNCRSSISSNNNFLNSAIGFCNVFSNHPACKCSKFVSTAEYKDILKDLEAKGISAASQTSHLCWAPACLTDSDPNNPDRRILSQPEQVTSTSCPNVASTYCTQVLNIRDVQGNVMLGNVNLVNKCQTVVQTQPTPSTPTPSTTPTPSKPLTTGKTLVTSNKSSTTNIDSKDIGWIIAVSIGAVILIVALIFLFK